MTLHWMMEHTDKEVWDKEFRPVFFPDPDQIPRQASKAKLADAKPGQEGSLNIKPKAEKVVVTDLSQFIGRAGGTGKADPNKAVMRQRARKADIKIAPDAEGNLTVDAPD